MRLPLRPSSHEPRRRIKAVSGVSMPTRAAAANTHAVLVLDQAGWHGSRALQVPANITLVPLPPYSPGLNPVERVWLYLRERSLSHRLLADYEAVVDACCAAWNALTAEAGRLQCRRTPCAASAAGSPRSTRCRHRPRRTLASTPR